MVNITKTIEMKLELGRESGGKIIKIDIEKLVQSGEKKTKKGRARWIDDIEKEKVKNFWKRMRSITKQTKKG